MEKAENIFNRPPAVSEDTVQYVIYLPKGQSDKASATTLAVLMQNYADSLLPEMQWHRDGFQLKVVPHPLGSGFILEGRMRVGDSIDDEWCAVWLLREITAKWDVAVRMFDTDGEFLLIEAADDLPSWVTPANAENRVWIYQKHLHLVPIDHTDLTTSNVRRRGYPGIREDDEDDPMEDNSGFITEQHAVELVRNPVAETQVSASIEQAAWQRIAGYPARARTHIHFARARLPVAVAKALTADPSLVQKAVETFYTRDALQLRAAHRMARFPPEPSVDMTVKLTRTAYAQLVGQKFYPPKVFGRWTEPEDSSEYKTKDLGMKIACGFEMLYQESKNRKLSADAIAPEARKDALKQNSDYRQFIENLKSVGYFKSNLEGSEAWNRLEDQAVNAFLEARRDDDASRPSFASLVDTAISQAGDTASIPDFPPDQDDWLNVDAESFDAMLEGSLRQSAEKPAQGGADTSGASQSDAAARQEDELSSEQASRLRDLAQKVEEFVEGKGDLEGAIFDDEKLSADEDSDDSDDESSEHSDVETRMDVDKRSPMPDAERQAAMEKLVPGIDPSEYGKMPASYYSSSQRVAKTTIETDVLDNAPNAAAPFEAGSSASASSSTRTRPIRPPILTRDEYEGVDSDDESDEEGDEDEESEEEKPQVVGEIEIDMEQEQEEFLEFARQALGITEDQWRDIVKERKDQGAFVPELKAGGAPPTKGSSAPSERSQRAPEPTAGRPATNPELDSFESLMKAMDAELERSRTVGSSSVNPDNGKGKGKQSPEAGSPEGGDIEAAMEAELQAMLDRGPQDDEELELPDASQHAEYNLIKNFLESFKSQAGQSGPVGNLAGRLQPGWQIPRDET
ncbi:SGT1-domain-containing protein [Phanerochaete sordida]|uniref:SGT1-domain-containing protein n=1 Tax=Phanerochaete sordida TaxID=48140 RepID=A0A9P3G3W3_9APHY|nr:SGT1-domain-containing protein [Phanerochaete sordida]